MQIKVSIIIPIYNVEDYIEQCIKSVLKQTLKEIEIILIDDGSKDNSINIVKTFQDRRLRIITQENRGLSAARNAGIKASHGEYIIFLDSDDFWNSDTCIEEMYNLAIVNKSDIVVGNGVEYYSDKKQLEFYRDRDEFYDRNMNSKNFLIKFIKNYSMRPEVWLNLYKREIITKNNLLFKEGIIHEDELFTPQVFLLAKNIHIYNKNFYVYRQRTNSIMHSDNSRKRGEDLIVIAKELINKYELINDKDLKNILNEKPFNLIQIALLEHNAKSINLKLKLFLLRKSKSKKQLILFLILLINKEIYIKIAKKISREVKSGRGINFDNSTSI